MKIHCKNYNFISAAVWLFASTRAEPLAPVPFLTTRRSQSSRTDPIRSPSPSLSIPFQPGSPPMRRESVESPPTEPSFQPSTEAPLVVENDGLHTLEVDPIQKFNEFQTEIYEKVIENLTASFGHMLDDPYITSNCTVFRQSLGSNGTSTTLILGFSIRYESNFGYPVLYYPYLLQDYINNHMQEMTSLMQSAYLDNVVRVFEVKMYYFNNTMLPTNTSSDYTAPPIPSRNPSSSATGNPTYFSTHTNKPSDTSSIPSVTPSFLPSTSISLAIQKRGRQPLEVDPLVRFDPFEVDVYERIMQNYTANFGHKVGEPFIITTCNVTDQQFLSNGVTNQLQLSFNMRYESRFGFDVANYTRLFQSYINDNLNEVTLYMQEHFLTNVIQAGRVQMFFTRSPTNSPTISSSPTHTNESNIPPETSDPSISPSFSPVPTVSLEPSSSPSISVFPTAGPTSTPSFFPSTENSLAIQTSGLQFIEVDPVREFNDFEVQVYQRIMQNYTASFGHMVGIPFIVTTCTVIEQAIATTGTDSLLLLAFSMRFESNFGYNVDDYPGLFQRYINDNLDALSANMRMMFLENVVHAQRVQMFQTIRPTYSPTASPIGSATDSPTVNPTLDPTDFKRAPSVVPTETETSLPSMSPSGEVFTYAPTREVLEEKGLAAWKKGLLGIGVGLFGSAVLVALFILLKRLRNKQQDGVPDLTPISQRNEPEGIKDEERSESNNDDAFTVETSLYVGSPRSDNPSTGSEEKAKPSTEDPNDGMTNSSLPSQSQNTSQFTDVSETSARLMKTGSIYHDELENMRKSIVQSVRGSDPYVSVAMARALMDGDDDDVVDSWNETFGVDCFEANCLCETHEWLRKNDDISLDSTAEFFQELLNKVISFVHRGFILSDDATRTIHGCATMLGLPLETELLDNVLIITSLRKSNSLEAGKFYLYETFNEFGQVETAALAPRNHGFGFVRFFSPKSVQRAMRAFRVSYVEVQDTAVMLNTLRTVIEEKKAHGHLKY